MQRAGQLQAVDGHKLSAGCTCMHPGSKERLIDAGSFARAWHAAHVQNARASVCTGASMASTPHDVSSWLHARAVALCAAAMLHTIE